MHRALLTLLASILRSAIALFEVEKTRPSSSSHFASSWPSTFIAIRDRDSRRWTEPSVSPSLGSGPIGGVFSLSFDRRPSSAGTARPSAATGGGSPSEDPVGLRFRGNEGVDLRMATENGWRARKIQAELSKLGIHLGLTTISRYLPKVDASGNPHQRWMTFLRNHRDLIAAMDFFVVPTVSFTLLYVWFILDHGRRRVLHFNVTGHPSARWVIQQLRETFPDHPTHRYLVLDNDAIFSAEVVRTAARFRLHPQRTALQRPWQNGAAERFVGTVRREFLDHVVPFGEDHLRRLLREYVEYYNTIAFTRRSATRRPGARQKRSRRESQGHPAPARRRSPWPTWRDAA